MPRSLRLLLLTLGLLFLCCALVALAYALWPVETTQLQATLAPTLFSPPAVTP
jgi:hypothetical protein